MINTYISALIDYATRTGLISFADKIYATNKILEILKLDVYEEPAYCPELELEEILKGLLDFAVEREIIEDNIVARDLFDTKLMGALTPRPSEVISQFLENYCESPKAATDYYYKLSCDSDYIRRYRIKKDMKWQLTPRPLKNFWILLSYSPTILLALMPTYQ